MKERIFAFDERNYHECQAGFRGKNNQEYYAGKYLIDAAPNIDVRADKKSVGAITIVNLISKSRLFFQRSWQHIQEDATDLTVVWFIKRGSMHLSRQNETVVFHAGELGIIKSLSPLSLECHTDDASVLEVLHILIPTYMFKRFIPDEITTCFSSVTDKREFSIAERLFREVFEFDGEQGGCTDQVLVQSALSLLTEGVKQCENSLQRRQTLSQKRYLDVLNYVEIHLTDPALNAESVAQACGISRRYLSHLCKQHNTSIPDLIWGGRLQSARDWLSSQSKTQIPISEVAYRNGFKSPGHFSRLFKQVYNMTPSEFRADQLNGRQSL